MSPNLTPAETCGAAPAALFLLVSVLIFAAGFILEVYHLTFLAEILIWGLFALSFALVYGFAGMLSLAQAIFFGMGCWGYNVVFFRYELSGWWPVVAGVAAAVVFAIPSGYFATRLRNHYFLIVTVILSILMTAVLASGHWRWIAGPYVTRSLPEAPHINLGQLVIDYGSDRQAFFLTAAIILIACLLAWLLVRSPYGKALAAVRDNELRAELIGLRVNTLRWVMFVIAAGYAGLAGVLYLMLCRYSNLEFFDWSYSGRAVVMAILGGVSTIFGPFLGTALYMIAAEYLSGFMESFMVLFGILLLLIIRFLPEGLWGALLRIIKDW
jgi:branched-chain amino acid transport system permease protein